MTPKYTFLSFLCTKRARVCSIQKDLEVNLSRSSSNVACTNGNQAPFKFKLYQNFVSVVIVYTLSTFGLISTEPLTWRLIRVWLPVNAIFVGMLLTSIFSLKYINVAMVTVLKNVTNVITAIGETYLFKKQHGNQVWAALFLMVFNFISPSTEETKRRNFMGSEVPSEMVINGGAPRRQNTKFAFACAMLASMTSILLGYDIGVMSGAALFIKDDLKITDTEVEILIGIMNLYSLIGSFAAGRTSDWIGRRYTIVLAAVIFFVGALIMGLSPNFTVLMIGRFVAGIGVGYALMIAPVYTSEVSPALSRGYLTSFPEVFINTGILLGYASNCAFAYLPEWLGWRLMLGVGAIPSVR